MAEPASRWDETPTFGSSYTSPGWRRAQDRAQDLGKTGAPRRLRRETIEGDGRLIASSDPAAAGKGLKVGERVFHQKFGYGLILLAEGAKLTVAFEKAGEKRVIDSFLEKA